MTSPGPMPAQQFLDWQTIDPATIKARETVIEETLVYRERIEELMQAGEGRYVLIAGRDVVDFFDDLRSAAEYAMQHFDQASVLNNRVALIEPIHYLGAIRFPESIDLPPKA